ncbi:MAG: hypothetical protein ACK4PR_10705, partial [Gammaproteobacteria bacterium]
MTKPKSKKKSGINIEVEAANILNAIGDGDINVKAKTVNVLNAQDISGILNNESIPIAERVRLIEVNMQTINVTSQAAADVMPVFTAMRQMPQDLPAELKYQIIIKAMDNQKEIQFAKINQQPLQVDKDKSDIVNTSQTISQVSKEINMEGQQEQPKDTRHNKLASEQSVVQEQTGALIDVKGRVAGLAKAVAFSMPVNIKVDEHASVGGVQAVAIGDLDASLLKSSKKGLLEEVIDSVLGETDPVIKATQEQLAFLRDMLRLPNLPNERELALYNRLEQAMSALKSYYEQKQRLGNAHPSSQPGFYPGSYNIIALGGSNVNVQHGQQSSAKEENKPAEFIQEYQAKLNQERKANWLYLEHVRFLQSQSRLYLFGVAPAEEF